MDPETVQQLLEINRRFYSAYGSSFAATRRRIQEGARRVLERLPDAPGDAWLDLGCGPGALAAEWLKRDRLSAYLGVDFSGPLLEEARGQVAGLPGAERVSFRQVDLSQAGWESSLGGPFAGALALAVLHHLPSAALRQRVLRAVRGLLVPGGRFIHSEWQFQHSPKLMARRVPWQAAGIDDSRLEPGDTLLDWRAPGPVPPEAAAPANLRYVHLFTPVELGDLARAAGFRVVETFESDGRGGRLALYQVWEAA